MVVYDVTNRDSFDALHNWMAEIEKYAVAGVAKIIVGNKADMESQRQVSKAEGAAVAKKYGVKYLETSAKSALNVFDCFQTMAREMLTRMNKKALKSTPGQSKGSIGEGKKITLTTAEATKEPKSKSGCC